MSISPTTSPRKAIANHCKGCIYDSQDKGTWLQQVEDCTITECALYRHRPLTSKTRRLRNETHLASLTHSEREIVQRRQENAIRNMQNLRLQQQAKNQHEK